MKNVHRENLNLSESILRNSGGVESTRLGTFAVTYGADNAYAGTVRAWV